MHISKREAEAEAIRIAEAFIAANSREVRSWTWKCVGARPDVLAEGAARRKTVVKWSVCVKWMPEGGGACDGASIVLVNIETKEAKFM